MKSSRSENIEKLSDTQLYALAQFKLLEPELLTQVNSAIEDRNIDVAAFKNRWDRQLQNPTFKLSTKEQITLWILAIFFPLGLGLITLLLTYFYFLPNPYRFQVYWKRSMISLIAWCVVSICYYCINV